MSDKKGGLSAFLNKNKKAKKQNQAATDKPAETKADAGQAAGEEAKDQAAQDAQVIKKQEPSAAKTGKSQESSDEDDGDDNDLNYGVIKETKVNEQQKQTKVDWLDGDKTDQKDKTAAADKPKKTGEINFSKGGKPPTFRRGAKGKLGGEFSKGLDDLDDDGGDEKVKQGPSEQESGAGGGRQFINLSSSAQTRDHNEEEKKESKPTGVKPTFRGKANLKGTGGGQGKEEEDTGPKHTYDFQVAFRGQGDDKREKKEEGNNTEERQGTAQRGGGRGRRGGRGRGFGQSQAQQDEDDGFEVVRGGRPKPKRKQHNDSSDSDETPAQGGARGGRGRGRGGGFFTNSGRNRIQD